MTVTTEIIPNKLAPDRLNKGNYLLSLAGEAQSLGLCTPEEYSSLEAQIYECLGARILLYNGGNSASADIDTASRLLGSILYTADLALLSLTPEEALSRILSEPLFDICCDGMKKAGEYVLNSLHLLKEAKVGRIRTVCQAYNRLLDTEIKKLIRAYDIRFDARRSLITKNYPMPTVNRGVRGIGGMIHMLTELVTENKFVNSFEPEEFDTVQLRNAPELTNPFGGTIINLGELVFEQAILNLMAGKPAGSLVLSDADCKKLTADYTSADAYIAALGVMHRFSERAPEKYLMTLMQKFRPTLTAIFSGGETAIRNFAGFRDRHW